MDKYRDAIAAAGHETDWYNGYPREGWKKAKLLFYPLFEEWRSLLSHRLESGQRFLSPEDVAAIDPPQGLKSLVQEWLVLASGVVKGYISGYVAPNLEDLCR